MQTSQNGNRRRAVALCVASLALLAGTAAANEPTSQKPVIAGEETIATVNGEAISADDFRSFFRAYMAQKYYHGVEEDKRPAIADDAMTMLIKDRLLLQEARKRRLKGDRNEADRRLEQMRKRFVARAPEKEAEFDAQSAQIEAEILDDTRIEELQKAVKDAGELSPDDVRAFYDSNRKLFTTPQTIDISMILVGVPPGGLSEEWHDAVKKAAGLLSRIRDGESFETLASENSTDPSAEKGGRLGPLHAGQIPENVSTVLAATEIGEATDPIRILEGVAIFKVNARKPPALQPLADVRERAEALLRRQIEDEKWRDFLDHLRATAQINQLRSPAETVRDI